MASGFALQEQNSMCDSCHRQDKPHISYRVEVEQQLCDDCAQERQGSIKPLRKKVRWFCEKHPEEEAKIFCETHRIPICQVCAVTKPHKACENKDIQDELDDRKKHLLDLVDRGRVKGNELKEYSSTVIRSSENVEEHLKTLEEKILGVVQKQSKHAIEEKTQKSNKTNREADEEITKITSEINARRKRIFQEIDVEFNHENEEN